MNRYRRSPVGLWLHEGHRLTTESGVSVSTADRTAQGTIYSTPHPGADAPNWITVSDGANFYPYEYGEISLALTATSGKNYDVFRYLSAGAPVLGLSTAWTTDTARADAVSLLKGKYVLTADKTFVLAGTIRASGTDTTEDSGTGGGTGTSTKRFVWNAYNRVLRPILVSDATTSWTYATATIRQARATAANQAEVVTGDAVSLISLLAGCATLSAINLTFGTVGIGRDSTTAVADSWGAGSFPVVVTSVACTGSDIGGLAEIVPLGYHYYAWLEKVTAATTVTFYGNDPGNLRRAGFVGQFEC